MCSPAEQNRLASLTAVLNCVVSLIVSSTATVAFLGTGRMGGAMVRRIHAAGHRLVLWNRDATKSRALGGELDVEVSGSPAEAAAGADVIVSSLADDGALREVYCGATGVVEGVRPGAIAVDTSTVDPETSKEIGEAVDGAGAAFLDAPVSGSVSTVEQGALTIMVGGEEAVVERVRPVFEPLASRVIHTGARGSGSAAKLAVNALVHGLNVALAEALVLAERAGVDRHTAYEIFASGAGGAPFVHYKRQAFENPDDAAVAFSLDLVAKDLELIMGLGRRTGAPMAQAETGYDIVRRAIGAGMGERDLSAVAVFLRGEET